jgi:hypothetical protein
MKIKGDYIRGNNINLISKGTGNPNKAPLITTQPFMKYGTTTDSIARIDKLCQTTTDVLTCNDKLCQTHTDRITCNDNKCQTHTDNIARNDTFYNVKQGNYTYFHSHNTRAYTTCHKHRDCKFMLGGTRERERERERERTLRQAQRPRTC